MPLTIIETFVGAGGAHLGFKNAGFESVLVNDIDADTIKTLIQNKVVREDQCLTCPIEDITAERLKGCNPDVFFGGIVCKGFSMAEIGRAHV
jgi:DNA (cytosine-5)-methyltransferase 1